MALHRVDFHVLSDGSPEARLRCACRLAEAAFDQGRRVYVQTASLAESQRLDELLWTFNERSFVPHEIFNGNGPTHEQVRVLLGEAAAPATHRELLINLANALPAALESYAGIAEIVALDPEQKKQSRERYKTYRALGCALEMHNL